jgi:general secretion pathway protein L
MISLDSSIGIDIKEDCLSMVHLQKSVRSMGLKHYDTIPLPSPDESKEKRVRIVIEGVNDFMKKVNVTIPKIFLSIPRKDVLLRYVTLPLTAKENLGQVLEYELERYVPFSLEEVYFDFQILKEREKTLQILLIVVKREVIHSYLDLLSLTNLHPTSLEVGPCALFNAFMDSKEALDEGPHALIELRRNHWELALVMGGTLAYSRAYPWRDGMISHFLQVKDELQGVFSHISEQESSITEDALYPSLKWVILNGMDADRGIMEEFLEQEEIPSSIGLRPNSLRDVPPDFYSLAAAYGAALRGLKKVPIHINLIPRDLRKHLKRPSLIPTAILTSLILFLGLAWGSSVLIRERYQLRKLNAQVRELEPDISAVERMRTEISQLQRKVGVLENVKKEYPSQLDILRELTTIIPGNTWLNRFTYRKGKIQLEGYAPSASDLIALLEKSPLFRNVRFPAPITKTREGLERFKVECSMEGIVGEEG